MNKKHVSSRGTHLLRRYAVSVSLTNSPEPSPSVLRCERRIDLIIISGSEGMKPASTMWYSGLHTVPPYRASW